MLLYDTKFLQLKSTPSKTGKEWVYAHRPNISGVVVILPIIEKDKILFLTEERPPLQAENISKYSIALPAGLVGDERSGETIEEAIKAELLEETGLLANKIEIKCKRLASSPGCVSEITTIAVAHINTYKIQQAPVDDGGVIVKRELVEINSIHKWLKEQEDKGAALSAQSLAALFYLSEEI